MHSEVSRARAVLAGMVLVVTACASVGDAASQSTPGAYLARSHSHNNYLAHRPLTEALELGFASIEVDVWLVDGALLVAHDREEVQPTATLAKLYLDPLHDVVRRNGGSVYGPDAPPLQLLVDVKSNADDTYRVLHSTLERYADMLTTWSDGVEKPGAITAVISGNRAIDLIAAAPVRYLAIDGRVNEPRGSVEMMPLVSTNWEDLPSSNLRGKLDEAESLVARMHSEGRKIRFWGTPDREDLWESLVAMGVDYVGTDDVPRLDRLLRRVGSPTLAVID